MNSVCHIGIITLFPQMFDALNYGVVGRAQEHQRITLHFWNPRDFTTDPYRKVDDRPFGGGPGMVLMYQPLRDAILAAKSTLGSDTPVIYLSPQGTVLKQVHFQSFTKLSKLILLCGRYEGIDERIITQFVNAEWSIGDYVLSGGEIPAMVFIDALSRLFHGVLGNNKSAEEESFTKPFFDYPHYTRPTSIDGLLVPEVLLSGDHARIASFRESKAKEKTLKYRPELIKANQTEDEENT